MKNGFVNIMEAILVIVALFIAFNVLFPGFSYKSKWDEAILLINGRDVVLTMDRIGKLHYFLSNTSRFQDFLERLIPAGLTGMLYWSEIEGTIKNMVVVACNCTNEQIIALEKWSEGMKVNGRNIDFLICYTELGVINPCIVRSDSLLIWGYKNITPYKDTLLEYLRKGKGIVELMDFDYVDNAQTEIFGIEGAGNWEETDFDFIEKPGSNDVRYYNYKIFYYFPIFLDTTPTPFMQLEIPSQPCTNIRFGNITFNSTKFNFWVCNSTHVFFDSNANGLADKIVKIREEFNLTNYRFFLNYIEDKVGLSFRPSYNFSDFCSVPTKSRILPAGNEFQRGIIKAVKRIGSSEELKGFCSVLNSTGKTIWISDFSRSGLEKVEDDQKKILISAILSTSNKQLSVPAYEIKTGYVTSYVNVVNYDMFEVYKFDFGLGYPFY
ncbi:MAG: hypothetical protein QXX38_01875 [Candidatus Aenigmatarchaeota archaeon]